MPSGREARPRLRRSVLAVTSGLAAAAASAPGVTLAIDPERSLSECSVEVWRATEGLPGAWIRGIAQTADGYLWIGTQGGPVRYGGGPLVPLLPERPFEHAADVMDLLAARDGAVWLKPSRGLPVCLRDDQLIPCFTGAASLSADTRVIDLAQDVRGAVWMALAAGIFRAPVTGGPLALVVPAAAWGGSPVSAVHHDSRGRLWVGTAHGLFVGPSASPPERLALHATAEGSLTAAVASFFETRGGTLWVAADGVIARIDGAQTALFSARDGLPPRRLTRILEDRDRNVWIGSREGLLRFRPGAGFATFTRADGLPDNDVTALFEDREGSLWVGTRAGGLAQFTDRTLDRQSGPATLRDVWISTVAEDREGVLWVGSARGLTRWRDGAEQTYTTADGLPSDQVLSLYPGRGAGEIWVGTERGLARFHAGRAEPVPGFTSVVSTLNLDHDGALWVGGVEGLARVDGGVVQRFPLHGGLRGFALGEIRDVERDDRGVVWISANGRLLRVDGGTLRSDPTPPAGTLSKVRSMWRDTDGTLWMGTGDGLLRRRHGRWRMFAAPEGLARSDLFQVAADDLGHLWIGALHGVLRISKAALEEVDRGGRRTLDLVAFDISDQHREVRLNRTRQPGVWKGRDGRLHFATGRGVVSVDPRRSPSNPLPPPVFIEKALVDGRPARRGGANLFPPGSGALEFHFAAITLLDPRKARHRYLLEGFDREWVDAGTRRMAYYTNIRPGSYRFRVQGSNADGVWNEAGDTITFTLAPHFHQARWFYLVVGLGVLGLALSFHRLRVAQLRGRYVATFAERARVARELHDSLLQGMAAAHMHLRGLRKRFGADRPPAEAETVARAIEDIEQLVANNIAETRQFVWDLRDGGDAVDLAAALEAVVARLGARQDSNLEVPVLVEGTPVRVPRHVRRELQRIVHEALTNALQHAEARTVEVRLRYQGATLRLTVSDDGRGFDPEAVARVKTDHFGVTGMRERAEMLGQFSLDSAPGRGTRVEVTVALEDTRDD